jgi:broad specificity phosphatase PhoE
MQLLLIRHGRPENGISDPKLSEMGRARAATLSRFLGRAGIDAILASPLRRAVETAEPTAKALGLDIRLVDGLAEADRFGAQYRSIEELRRSPQEWAKFLADPIGFLGGNAATFKRDVVGAIDLALASGGNGKVALFTHGLPINVVLSHALGLEKITHFVPHYCSITRIRGNSSDDLTVISVNETIFLEQADQ